MAGLPSESWVEHWNCNGVCCLKGHLFGVVKEGWKRSNWQGMRARCEDSLISYWRVSDVLVSNVCNDWLPPISITRASNHCGIDQMR